MTTTNKLHPFEGRDVVQATIKVTRAGDGLSEALSIEPVEMRQGETVYLVIETEVDRVTFEPIKDTDVMRRVHTLRAGTATIVDAGFAGDVIEQQRKAIMSAKGVEEFDFSDAEIAEQMEKERRENEG